MRIKKGMSVLASGLTLALVAAACGGDGGSGGEGDSGGELVYGEGTAFPANLMPLIAAGNSTSIGYLEINILPATFRITPEFEVKADTDLLTEEPVSKVDGDTQVVTYKLNPDAVWSDGDPIDVADFEYFWRIQRSADPADGGCASILSTTGYEDIQSVEAGADDKEVAVTFSPPFSDWRNLFRGFFPEHLMDKDDPVADCETITAGWPTAEGIVGEASGGPWQLKKSGIDEGREVFVLTPNESYWGEKPKLDRLIHQTVGNEPNTIVKALEGGEIHMIYPQPQLDLIQQVKDLEPDVTNQVEFGLSFEHLDFNTRNQHLKLPQIRQAFAMALDRAELVEATVGQFDSRAQVLGNRLIVNNQPGYEDNAPEQYQARDVAGAKALIESAGYTMGSDGVYVSPSGERLSLELTTTQNNPLRENTLQVVTEMIKEAGIEGRMFLNPEIFEGAESAKSLEAGGFDVALFAWVNAPFVSGHRSIYQSVVGGAQGQNYTHGGDPDVDRLFGDLAKATETQEQIDVANQIDQQLWENLFTLPLYQRVNMMAFNGQYDGLQINGTTEGPLWNSPQWSVKQ